MGFELDPSYNEVADRIREFRAKHPDGSLDALDRAKPFEVVELAGKTFIVVASAAYRSPDDPHPGVGLAWEPFPGKTPYTRDSEMQNAQTSSWGRAIVAALAADAKHVASANEVRNRRADQDEPPTSPALPASSSPEPVDPSHAERIRALVADVPEEWRADLGKQWREGLIPSATKPDPAYPFDQAAEDAARLLVVEYLERAERREREIALLGTVSDERAAEIVRDVAGDGPLTGTEAELAEIERMTE